MDDPERQFRSALNDAIKHYHKVYGKDRKQLAAELSECLGRPETDDHGDYLRRPVSESMLNEFTRSTQPGRDSQLPAAWVRIVCEITGDDTPARHTLPERLRCALSVGELVVECPRLLRQALAEIEKLTKGRPRKRR